jgi:hypothetical protein
MCKRPSEADSATLPHLPQAILDAIREGCKAFEAAFPLRQVTSAALGIGAVTVLQPAVLRGAHSDNTAVGSSSLARVLWWPCLGSKRHLEQRSDDTPGIIRISNSQKI